MEVQKFQVGDRVTVRVDEGLGLRFTDEGEVARCFPPDGTGTAEPEWHYLIALHAAYYRAAESRLTAADRHVIG